MACSAGRKNHRWEGDSCVECGAARGVAPQETEQGAAVGSGIGGESLDDIKAQQGAAGGGFSGSKYARRKAQSLADERKSAEDRKIQGEMVAQGIHQLQGFVAQYAYRYEGTAFELSADEVSKLGVAYGNVMEAFGIVFDSKWAAVAMLGVTEFAISKRQWSQAMEEVSQQDRAAATAKANR